MKENKLVIRIKSTPKKIVDFCLGPKNTPKWLDSIIVEQTNEWPVKIGTIYRNQNKKREWSEYKVIARSLTMFEFISTTSTYHVRYTTRQISPDVTELEYFEWMEAGDLPEPFTLEPLQKLKNILEN